MERIEWILMIAIFVCLHFEFPIIGIWLMSVWIFYGAVHNTFPSFYREIISDYPREQCVKPKFLKWMFPFNGDHPDKELPKEIYIMGIEIFLSLVLHTVLLPAMFLMGEDGPELAFSFLVWDGVFVMFMLLRGSYKGFIDHYKIMNRYNFKFYILPDGEPYPCKVGKCEIVKTYKKKRKTFATVRMLDDGEMISDVLVSGNGKKEKGGNIRYQMYEICKEKYII